jgi:outer membrane immunogenic protein
MKEKPLIRKAIVCILLLVPVHLLARQLQAQKTQNQGELSVAVTYNASRANLTTGNSFWMQGGSVELAGQFGYGFSMVASVSGLHAGSLPVQQNLVTVVFGPRYTWVTHRGKHPLRLFGEVLGGEADGFYGVYPAPVNGPASSALSVAFKTGGGVDLGISRHLDVRLLQADWLRTQLPNSTTNVQNFLLIGAGVVLHSAPR